MIFFILFLLIFSPPQSRAEEIDFPQSQKSAAKFFVGEKLIYSIRYLGVPIGRAEGEVKERILFNGRPAYHLFVTVHSYPVIDWVYKVRDLHHSFVDAEKFYSLGYEKEIREGSRRAREKISYDPIHHKAAIFYPDKNLKKEMPIPPDIQDPLSCGYWFRLLDLKAGRPVFIPVNAGEKNWTMQVKLHGAKPMKIKGVGRFTALEAEPVIDYQGLFVKRGKIRGWVSLDERRIPLKMKVEVPVVGHVVAELIEYHPGNPKDETQS